STTGAAAPNTELAPQRAVQAPWRHTPSPVSSAQAVPAAGAVPGAHRCWAVHTSGPLHASPSSQRASDSHVYAQSLRQPSLSSSFTSPARESTTPSPHTLGLQTSCTHTRPMSQSVPSTWPAHGSPPACGRSVEPASVVVWVAPHASASRERSNEKRGIHEC